MYWNNNLFVDISSSKTGISIRQESITLVTHASHCSAALVWANSQSYRWGDCIEVELERVDPLALRWWTLAQMSRRGRNKSTKAVGGCRSPISGFTSVNVKTRAAHLNTGGGTWPETHTREERREENLAGNFCGEWGEGLQEKVWRRKEKHRGGRGGGVQHAECTVWHKRRWWNMNVKNRSSV